jgi:hypothetical protein
VRAGRKVKVDYPEGLMSGNGLADRKKVKNLNPTRVGEGLSDGVMKEVTPINENECPTVMHAVVVIVCLEGGEGECQSCGVETAKPSLLEADYGRVLKET